VDSASRHGGFLGDKRTSGMKTRLDRLARSTRDLLNTLAQIADKGVGFYSLTDAGGHRDRARAAHAHRVGRAC